MQGTVRNMVAGVVSGIATCLASIAALGYTNAIVMPSWASPALWDAIVVFGLGAALVALVIHVVALRMFRADAGWAFASFLGTVLLALLASGQLAHGSRVIIAWLAGSALASLVCRR